MPFDPQLTSYVCTLCVNAIFFHRMFTEVSPGLERTTNIYVRYIYIERERVTVDSIGRLALLMIIKLHN